MTEASQRVRFSSPKTLGPTPGYSHLAEVHAGRVVWIAGQVSQNARGEIVGTGDFAAQVAQVFENLQVAVDEVGATMADVVKLNYYCVDSVPGDQIVAVRSIRDRYVNTEAPPASTFVFVSRLVRPEWLIEIEAVVAAPD